MRMNQDLLHRLQAKLGVGSGRVYSRIASKASKMALPRELAIFLVASDCGINYQKYATQAELERVRAAISGGNSLSSMSAAQSAVERPRRVSEPARKAAKVSRTKDSSVFVVYGRDEGLRKAMFEFLLELRLNPIEWNKAVLLPKRGGGNPHVDQIVEEAMEHAQAVVVIFSPDDLAQLRPSLLRKGEKAAEGKLQGQPRPNVFFEAGLALGRHPRKTLLIQIGKVRGFSDIEGMHLVRLTNDADKRQDVANRLEKIGCKVDTRGNDWRVAGDFTPKM